MSPGDLYSRGLVPTTVQRIHFFATADEAYVADRAWERAVLDECPFHSGGDCVLVRHGSYPRVRPQGMRIARFWCSVAGASISLLPSFLASRLSGTLDEIESAVTTVESMTRLAAAADRLRPADAEDAVTSISAARWVRRRLLLALAVVEGPGPDLDHAA